MAQEVGYYEDNVKFTEGPFVIVQLTLGSGDWRIEAEVIGNKCPALPDTSIYHHMMKEWNFCGRGTKQECIRVCDLLNQMFRDGQIVEKNHWWVIEPVCDHIFEPFRVGPMPEGMNAAVHCKKCGDVFFRPVPAKFMEWFPTNNKGVRS